MPLELVMDAAERVITGLKKVISDNSSYRELSAEEMNNTYSGLHDAVTFYASRTEKKGKMDNLYSKIGEVLDEMTSTIEGLDSGSQIDMRGINKAFGKVNQRSSDETASGKQMSMIKDLILEAYVLIEAEACYNILLHASERGDVDITKEGLRAKKPQELKEMLPEYIDKFDHYIMVQCIKNIRNNSYKKMCDSGILLPSASSD